MTINTRYGSHKAELRTAKSQGENTSFFSILDFIAYIIVSCRPQDSTHVQENAEYFDE